MSEKTSREIDGRISLDTHIQKLWVRLRHSENKEDIELIDSLSKHPAIKAATR